MYMYIVLTHSGISFRPKFTIPLSKHRHAKRARVIFLVIGVFVELFTVMSFFGGVAMYSKKETGNL